MCSEALYNGIHNQKNSIKWCFTFMIVTVIIIIGSTFSYLHSEQMLLTNREFTFNSMWITRVGFDGNVPQNWNDPVQYAGGKTYIRLKIDNVHKKFQFWYLINNADNNDEKHYWNRFSPINSPGIYYNEKTNGSQGDFMSTRVKDLLLGITNDGGSAAGYPGGSFTVHIWAYQVSQGGNFIPPQGWNENAVNAHPTSNKIVKSSPFSIQNSSSGLTILTSEPGNHKISVFKSSGEKVASFDGEGIKKYVIKNLYSNTNGLLLIRIHSDGKFYSQQIITSLH